MTEIRYATLPPIWPGGKRTAYPKRSNFATPWVKTLGQLDKELWHLGVRNDVVCETGFEQWQIRLDGQPRAGVAAKGDQAVILNFTSKHGPLRYWCDTYDRRQDNIRAITLSLEALRSVERWGVLNRGEQYTGNLALPVGMGPTEAEQFIRDHGDHSSEVRTLRAVYLSAAKKLHPDAGGDRHDWDALQRAKEVLGL